MTKTKLFIDGPNFDEIQLFKKQVDGFTFNPSLFKKLGAEDYMDFTKKILQFTDEKSVSIEVIGDDEETCFNQALKISKISNNISVKIPIIYTNGQSTINLIEKYDFHEYFEAQKEVAKDLQSGYGGKDFSWTSSTIIHLFFFSKLPSICFCNP